MNIILIMISTVIEHGTLAGRLLQNFSSIDALSLRVIFALSFRSQTSKGRVVCRPL